MPIYAYRCEACGFAKDVLQKMSDATLTDCLSCGKPAFKKQVTAAGFQLKGSGWYVTDFRGNGSKPASDAAKGGVVASPGDAAPASSSESASNTVTPSSTTSAPASASVESSTKSAT